MFNCMYVDTDIDDDISPAEELCITKTANYGTFTTDICHGVLENWPHYLLQWLEIIDTIG